MFAGQLTIYTIRYAKISYRLSFKYSQIDLQPTPPDTLRSATALYIDVRTFTHKLLHQTPQD
jgi:hypothetical protein